VYGRGRERVRSKKVLCGGERDKKGETHTHLPGARKEIDPQPEYPASTLLSVGRKVEKRIMINVISLLNSQISTSFSKTCSIFSSYVAIKLNIFFQKNKS
jgi:hypothetical protein